MYIVNYQQKYLRIAKIVGGYVDTFYIDDFFSFERMVPALDDVYVARVVGVKHGVVYVDIGDSHVAVLKSKKNYSEGAYVLVQVVRERMFDVGEVYKLGSKGCRVVDTIALVSPTAIAQFQQGSDLIKTHIRDHAKNLSQEALDQAVDAIQADAHAILKSFTNKIMRVSRGPTQLERLLRDAQAPLIFDHADTYLRAKSQSEQNGWRNELKLELHQNIFDDYEDVWAELFLNTLMLQDGGNISIAPSPIGWIVDVNAEGAEPERVNRAAAEAIIRQIKLRNLSGNVIVDFAPSRKRDSLLNMLMNDLPKTFQVLGWTTGGLVELRAAKHRPANTEIIENLSDFFR